MPKSKKPKKVPYLQPEFILEKHKGTPNPPRKKNAPDRPQPSWLFPPAEENPVLNPKAKSEETKRREKEDHDAAVKFLQYRSVTAPVKAPPPAKLLTLVGGFLSSYGFSSTSRIFSTELASRRKLDEWKVVLDEPLPKGFPNLVKVYRDGYKLHEERNHQGASTGKLEDEDDEDDDDDDQTGPRKKHKKNGEVKDSEMKELVADHDDTSSSGESDSSDDEESTDGDGDLKMENAASDAVAIHGEKAVVPDKSEASSPSTSSSDSEASSDEEEGTKEISVGGQGDTSLATPLGASEDTSSDEKEMPKKSVARSDSKDVPSASAHKRDSALTSDSSSSSSSSSPASSMSHSESDHKKKSINNIVPKNGKSVSSSSDSSSDSDSESQDVSRTGVALNGAITESKRRTGSSSSETLQATSVQKLPPVNMRATSVSDALGVDLVGKEQSTTITTTTVSSSKRKRVSSPTAQASTKKSKDDKIPNERFQRVPKDTAVDEKFSSNKYQSYDYADRAHQDLVVTKGRGFTKEKNKKKRGSYRGGAIDTSGGKGIKFDD